MKISTDNRILAFIAGYTRQHEGAPVFSGPFCMNDIHEAGDVIACCAMTEEAYDSAIEKYLGL